MQLPYSRNNSVVSAFAVSPRSITFEEQRDTEQLYLLVRKHPVTNVPWITLTIVLLFAPLIGSYFVQNFAPSLTEGIGAGMQFLLFVFWYIIVFVYAYEQFLLWFFSVNIITDDRIVDIDFKGLFAKEFAEVQLSKIQDVHSDVIGPLAIIFNFGTVTVQTAAEQTVVEFDNVPRPDQVSKFIGELVAETTGVQLVNRKEK